MTAALFLLLVVLGAVCRSCMQLSAACLHVGKAISDTDSKTGFQDAITPPMLANVMIGTLIATLAALIGLFVQQSIWQVALGIIAFFVAMLLAGLLLPKPEHSFWLKLIFNSLVNRSADYAKANDALRSEASRELADRIADRFSAALRV